MTASEVRDILAAWQLIEKHGLSIYPQRSLADAMIEGWWCTAYDGAESWPIADTPLAAVRAWAEAAGVPWPEIEAVEMWSRKHRGETRVVQASRYGAKSHADACGMSATVVPCVVVLNREGE